MAESTSHYQAPGFATKRILNPVVRGLTRAGISVMGSRVLVVKGRKTGELRRTPVNLLTLDGNEYLVAPRSEAQWVRNVRADDGRLSLQVGRRRTSSVASEVADRDKAEILRAYLRRWKGEAGAFFGGIDADASDEELLAIAPRHPVFSLQVQ